MLASFFKITSACLVLAVLALCPNPAKAASFECSGKLTQVEQMICTNPRLSKYDEQMYALYLPIKKVHHDAVLSQRDWLKYGRNRCADVTCLAEAYVLRINEFKAGDFRNWAAMNMPEMAAIGSSTPGVNYQASVKSSAAIAQWMRESRILETSLAFAKSKYAYPANLRLVAKDCAVPNAFYLWESEAVVFCYELAGRLLESYQNALQDHVTTEQQARQRFLYSVHYVLQHELGHAALHNQRAKHSFGNQEGEADNFAAISMISSARSDADLIDMIYGVKYFADAFHQQGLTLDALTDEHDLSERRYYSFACFAAGSNANIGRQFVQFAQLTEKKVMRCQVEWRNGKEAMSNLTNGQVDPSR